MFSTSSVLTIMPDPTQSVRRPLLTPLPEPGHFLLVIDNSSLDGFKRCAQYARNHLVLERQAHAKNAALTFGGAVHAGLDVMLQGMDAGELGTFDEAPDYANEHFDRRIAQTVVNFFADNPTPPDEYRTPAVACEVLGHYRQRAKLPDYEWEIARDEKGLMIERSFELPLAVVEVDAEIAMPWLDFMTLREINSKFTFAINPGRTYVSHIHVAWSGRIDVLATPAINGKLHVVDHKTSSYDAEDFFESFRLSSQTRGYVWAVNQLFPDLPCRDFLLNTLCLKKHTPGADLNARGPRGGSPPLSFSRTYYSYSDQQIEDWKTDTICHVSDFIHNLVRDRHPFNDSSCFNHKFKGKCEYHCACTIDDPVVRDRFLLSDAFKRVTWNPVRGE